MAAAVNVTAQDVAIDNDSIYEKTLTNELADGKAEIAKRMGSDFDITGSKEIAGSESENIKGVDMSDAANQLGENESININKDSGSSIITVAGGLAATIGKGAGGAAVAITDIENNYTANVEYADITAEKLNAEAGSDSNIVTVSGGIAAASKGSGVGSVTWNDVENTANVNIANSVIKAQAASANASNTAQIISVAGQISGAGKAGVGATLSYIGLDNSTEANITSTTFDKRDKEETEGITVSADAENRSGSYNVAAGVSAAGTAAVSGNVAVTQTHGTSGAVIDSAIINNAKKVSAHALDDTDILSVIGTVSAAGTASVGAGVAYTEIGSTSTDEVDAQQTVAAIENTDITTAASASGSTVSAQATDSSKVINVAVGIGGAGTAAVQGASATSLINKTTGAELTNTNIDKDSANSENANVTVDAQNNSEITSSADVASVAGTAGVGAGVAVNRIVQNTNAAVNSGTMHINNLTVNANGIPRIENIGIGVGAGGTAGVTGSVAVNMIANNVTAHIGNGANIVAGNNVGVIATSDEQIANYAGQLAVGGVGAGVGVSVSVNQIAGTTSATVGGEGEKETHVTALGKGESLDTTTKVDEKEINDELIASETIAMDSVINRGNESRSGLIVDASSTRDLKSFLITAGVAGTGAGVTGTVNVNQIDGKTTAGITNTTVNGGSANAAGAGNVFVNAGDYSNSSGFVGGGAVAGIGVGAGVAGIGGGVAGVVTVTELENVTKAALHNSNVNANKVTVNANHKGNTNAGNVGVGAAGLGAGVGLSVGVLKDDSKTYAGVSSDDETKDTITASGDVTIAATNTAVVKPEISATGVGAFAGVAGATSINNITSTVKTTINDVDITSGSNINGTADNNFNVDAYMGSQAGGIGGVGVGVTVNTIDSTVQTNVTDSTLDAKGDVTLTANEKRTISQTATNVAVGGVAVGANIAITNVGQAVENVKDENGEIVSNAADKIEEANKVYGEDNKDAVKLLEGAGSALDTAEIDTGSVTPHVDAGYGGVTDDNGNTVSQITVNITNSNIEAGSNVTAKATETDGITMTLGGASAGAVAVAAGVGMLNVHRNVGVDISGGSITAGNAVDVGTDITGEAELNVYQGSGGIIGANAAYAGVNTTGSSDINLNGVTIEGKNISIAAQDNAKTSLQAVGVAAGVAALGALAAEAANDSDVSVNMTGTTVTANEDKDDDESGKVEITTNKANTVTAQAVNTAGGAVAGAGMGATVTDTGSSTVYLAANEMFADKLIDVNAKTNSTLQADIVNNGAGWFAAGAVSIAKVSAGTADDPLKTAVTIGGGNTFAADDIAFAADSNITESMDMDALAISGYAAASGNSTTAGAYADAEVTAESTNTYTGADDDAGNVSFNANNTVKQTSDTSGISAAGLFATGTNVGKTNSGLNTTVDIKGSNYNSKIDNLTAAANSSVDINNAVNGDGGALFDVSPYAATTENSVTSNTNVNISGSWQNIAGDMNVKALHENKINLDTNALKAALIGLSGVHAKNKVKNNTGVKFDGANVTTGGSQTIAARNTVDYTNTVKGSGYGAISGAAVWAEDDMELTADVSIVNSSKLNAEESITVDALTGDAGYNPYGDPLASVDKEVTIQSAGVVAGTYAESTDNIDFINNIKVDKGSTIATIGRDTSKADITLTAADRTNFTDITTADTQGGVIGAAGSVLTNNFNRENTITVEGTVDSNHDANFDAGDTSELNLTLKSNAYNKTAAPIATEPSIKGIMKQTSTINFAKGSTVKSLRNINAAAGEGDTTIAKESKTWRWVDGGETGSGSIASTVDGELSPEDADVTTTVTVNGELEAGKNNELTITITDSKEQEAALDNAIKDYNGGEEFATAEDNLKDAQDAYDNYLTTSGLKDKSEQLTEAQKKYENNKNAYDVFKEQDGTISANLATAEKNLNAAKNELSAAKTDLDTWIDNKLAEYNNTLDKGDRITESTFVAGLTDSESAWYNTYHTEYDTKNNNINSINNKINGANGLQAVYDDYAAQKASNDANLAAFDIVALEQQIEQLNNEIEGIVSGADYIAVKEALDTAKVNYDAALEKRV